MSKSLQGQLRCAAIRRYPAVIPRHRRDAYASMKPTLSRPAAKIVFFLFFFILTRDQATTHPLALVLGRCGARYERRNDQTPKPVTLRARNVVGSRRATE